MLFLDRSLSLSAGENPLPPVPPPSSTGEDEESDKTALLYFVCIGEDPLDAVKKAASTSEADRTVMLLLPYWSLGDRVGDEEGGI